MEANYEDDYTGMIFMHPAEAYAHPKSPQPATSFDRTIEKMQKAIQLHSIKKRPAKKSGKMKDPQYRAYLKRDEYNPFLHNAWYLMGRAQYFKGDFLGAAATFHYITRHFTWKEELVLQSKLWEARCYCAEGWLTEADNILVRIKPDKITDKDTRYLYNLVYADYYIKNKNTKEAIPYLSYVAKHSKGGQKIRLNFLLGQVYSENDMNTLAYEAFKKAGSANASYRTKFNARIKQSEVFTGANIKSEVKALKGMARFDRNKDYLDQIYYAIGNLYLAHKDTVHAIENYILAAKKSTRNGMEKALSQIALGTLYFDMRNYADAQPCYAEAVPQLSDNYPNYEMLKRRSDVLDELAVYSQNVKLQDSLLILSKLSPEQQKEVAQKLVDTLVKKEKEEAEEAKREEYLAQRKAEGDKMNIGNTSAPATYALNNDKSWYFYNTATKNAGKTAFQKQWGSRKLEDNWRRRNKATFAMDDFEASNDDKTEESDTATITPEEKIDKEMQKKIEDPHFVEYYLKQIPKTPEEIQTCNDIIQEGLYNMGIILKDKLEDYPAAISEFNELLSRYPDNIYRLDVYYNMYLMYMRRDDIANAEKYRQLILSDFSESKYGMAMRDPNYLENLKNMEVDQELMYQEAYDAYLDNRNSAVHEAYQAMMSKYPLSKIMPKFMFINALSYVTEKKYDDFKATLKEMLERYPETDMTDIASSMLKQIAQGRKLEGGGKNVRGMIWSTRLTNDSTLNSAEAKLTPFEQSKDTPQLLVLVYSTDSIAPNQLLFDIAKHNFTSFVVRDFDIEQMNFGQLGLLIIKGFANFEELTHYRTVMEADEALKIPKSVRPVMISVNNFNLLLKEGRSFEEYFNFIEDANSDEVENKALEQENLPPHMEDTPTENTNQNKPQ